MYEYDYCFRKTGSNIRALREAFGETQLDLSLALNFDSSAAISMYESGTRGQNRVEVLEQIARHYRITLDDLLHKDFSTLHRSITRLGYLFTDPTSSDCISKEKISDLLKVLIPPANTEISAEASAAKILRQHLVRQAYASFPGLTSEFSRFTKNEISWIEFVRICWIRDDLFPDETLSQSSSVLPALHELTSSSEEPVLKRLYQAESWHQLAVYYQALQNALGFSKTGNNAAAVMAAGRSMMVSLAQTGNHYAEQLTEIVHELHSL